MYFCKIIVQDVFAQKVELPNEGEILELCRKTNSIFRNEQIILQAALPKENVDVISEQSRHHFCSLASYGLVPNLEVHTKPKQDVQKALKSDDSKNNWWSFIHKHFPFIKTFSKTNMVANAKNISVIPNFDDELEESKYKLNRRKESILLPHLEMGIKENILSNSILSNKKHSEIKENKKDVKNNEENAHSFSFTNEKYDEAQKKGKNIVIVE